MTRVQEGECRKVRSSCHLISLPPSSPKFNCPAHCGALQGVVPEREREHVRRQAASPGRRQQDPDARSEHSTRTVSCSALPPSTLLLGFLRRRCRRCDACAAPVLRQELHGSSYESHVVWVNRHCRPFNLKQPLKKQLQVGNPAGGSDESVKHGDSATAPTEPGSAMSD